MSAIIHKGHGYANTETMKIDQKNELKKYSSFCGYRELQRIVVVTCNAINQKKDMKYKTAISSISYQNRHENLRKFIRIDKCNKYIILWSQYLQDRTNRDLYDHKAEGSHFFNFILLKKKPMSDAILNPICSHYTSTSIYKYPIKRPHYPRIVKGRRSQSNSACP